MSLDYRTELVLGYKVPKEKIVKAIYKTEVKNSCEHKEKAGHKYCPVCGKEVKSYENKVFVKYEVFIPEFWDDYNEVFEQDESLEHNLLFERISNSDDDDFVIIGLEIKTPDIMYESETLKIEIPTQAEVDKAIGNIKIPKEEFGLYFINSIW